MIKFGSKQSNKHGSDGRDASVVRRGGRGTTNLASEREIAEVGTLKGVPRKGWWRK